MIKVEVTKKSISILGHANYSDYGKDIVCAAVSGIVICSIEGIAKLKKDAVDVIEKTNNLTININTEDNITNTLINNMLDCLKEIEKKYPKNIKITNKEE